MVLLPQQLEHLAFLGAQTGVAIGIFQDGSAIEVNLGVDAEKFWLDANGDDMDPPKQEYTC